MASWAAATKGVTFWVHRALLTPWVIPTVTHDGWGNLPGAERADVEMGVFLSVCSPRPESRHTGDSQLLLIPGREALPSPVSLSLRLSLPVSVHFAPLTFSLPQASGTQSACRRPLHGAVPVLPGAPLPHRLPTLCTQDPLLGVPIVPFGPGRKSLSHSVSFRVSCVFLEERRQPEGHFPSFF